jgi:hypothetical protein
MLFKLHEEGKIGVKQLSKADLGLSSTTHQTHIGLYDGVLAFLPNQNYEGKGMFIFNGKIEEELGFSFGRIENKDGSFRSPNIKTGGFGVVSIVSHIRSTVRSYEDDLNWYLIWFGLENKKVVFFLLNNESKDYEDINNIIDLPKNGKITEESTQGKLLIEYLENVINPKTIVNTEILETVQINNDVEDIEEEQIDEDLLLEKPFDPTKINIETKTPSLDTLISRIREKEIQMDTSTYFQRQDDLWDNTKQSRLIESILIRFPLPAFFFDASDDNNWLVVDGLQRLSSIRNFCVTQTLRLTNLEFLTQFNGKKWEDLSGDLKRVIKEAQMVIYKIMPGTPTDVKFNIFKRINTGGLVLEPQEIRHALFQGKPAQFIAELGKNNAFLEATNGKIKTHRMLDRDFANRFLAFYLLGFENYTPDLDTFMSKAMACIYDMSQEELEKITTDYTNAMVISKKLFKEEAFRKIYKSSKRLPPINKALFDALSTQFALLSQHDRETLAQKGKLFKKGLYDLLNNDDYFFTSVTSSTGDKNRVYYRHNEIKKLIHKIIES